MKMMMKKSHNHHCCCCKQSAYYFVCNAWNENENETRKSKLKHWIKAGTCDKEILNILCIESTSTICMEWGKLENENVSNQLGKSGEWKFSFKIFLLTFINSKVHLKLSHKDILLEIKLFSFQGASAIHLTMIRDKSVEEFWQMFSIFILPFGFGIFRAQLREIDGEDFVNF